MTVTSTPAPATTTTTPATTTTTTTQPDATPRFKERVTAGLAGAIVATMVTVVIFAACYATNDAAYKNAKDLLGWINPIVGYVIGYYFNKTVSDKSVTQAQTAAAQSDQKTAAVKSTLQTLATEARTMLSHATEASQSKTLGGPTATAPLPPPPNLERLKDAISQAEAMIKV